MKGLVLSLFPGIDMLGKGFEMSGFCVVRGPDIIYGQDVREFSPPSHAFEGIIGGPPCQDFSRKRRTAPTGAGLEMIKEYLRIVTEAKPQWFLIENVPSVPTVSLQGYKIQRFNLNAKECSLKQNRLRAFQFGSLDGRPLVIPRSQPPLDVSHCCLATEGQKTLATRRTFADFCELQGLPRGFTLPGMSVKAKYRAVGNGVPPPMAAVIARAILQRQLVTAFRLCICECGRPVHGKQVMATPACRKRMERNRDAAPVTGPGPLTPAESQDLFLLESHGL